MWLDDGPRSFASEGFYGVSESRTHGLNTDRQEGNGEGDGACQEEDPPTDLRTISKRIEPFVHGPPCDREGDERSDPDKHREVLADEADDTTDGGAEYFADPDLLGALFGSIGNEAEQTETGNKDGEDGEGDEYLAGLLLGVIQFIKVVIHEGVAEGQPLLSGMELTFHLPDEAGDIIRAEADGHAAPVIHVDHHDKGVYLVMHGVIIEILDNADDMKGERLEVIQLTGFELIRPIVEEHIERVLHAEHCCCGFIEDDGRGVGRKFREVEVAAFYHPHAQGGNIMVIDIDRGHDDHPPGVERGIPEPAWLTVLVAANSGEVAGGGCVADRGKVEQVLAKIFRTLLAERPGIMDNEYLIPVKADFLISNILQLAIDDQGADDEANRNKKLKDHQAVTQPAALEACGHLSFQYLNRLKGGKVKGGVAACETADQQHQNDEDKQEPATEEYAGMERFAGKLIEHRQQQNSDAKGEDEGEEAEQAGLGEELDDELSFCRAGNLADAHFHGAVGGAGGAEVHEIDAGDQKDEHGDDGEDVYELDIAVGLELTRLIGMEVYVGEREEVVPEMITPFLKIGLRTVERLLEGRADIAVDDFVYIFLHLGTRDAGLDQYIGIIITGYPVVVVGIIKGVGFAEGANEAEMELGLFRHVPDDPSDLEEEFIVNTHLQRAADDIGAVEIAAGGTFINHNGMRVVERGIGVAGNHGQGKDLEDRRVGEGEALVDDVVVALPHQQAARVAEPGHLPDLRIGTDESGTHKFGGGDSVDLGVIEVEILIDPIDAVCVDVVAVVTDFIRDVQDDQQTYTEAGSEADNVEGGKALAFPEAAEGDLEIISKHKAAV